MNRNLSNLFGKRLYCLIFLFAAISLTAGLEQASAKEVRVLQLKYAGQDGSGDFTAHMVSKCRGKELCEFRCNNGEFSDVDEHHSKYCYIRYSCDNGPSQELTYSEGDAIIKLDCR